METIEMPEAEADAAGHDFVCAVDLDWEFIKAQLPDGWRELAKKMGLI
jgi:hypothetical protein